jgi:hypothetical protein
MSTSRARTVVVIAVIGHYSGLGQVVDVDDARSGIGDIFTGSEHNMSPEDEGSDGECRRHHGPCLSQSQKSCYSVNNSDSYPLLHIPHPLDGDSRIFPGGILRTHSAPQPWYVGIA